MLILGIYHMHDACVALFDEYDMVVALAQERATRIKCDGGRFPVEAVQECLDHAGVKAADIGALVMPRVDYPNEHYRARAFFPKGRPSRGEEDLLRVTMRPWSRDPFTAFDWDGYLKPFGFRGDQVKAFYNHHAAHAYGTLFHTQWDDALIYTSDGGGDRTFYSARRLKNGQFTDVFGGEQASTAWRRPQHREDSLGLLYYHVTEALGFRPLRHEGKVLGLAAFGEPKHAPQFRANYTVMPDGQIKGSKKVEVIAEELRALAKTAKREDMAASVQHVLEEVTLEALERIAANNPSANLGVSGGVFANVKLTQRIAARFAFKDIFVYPAMSDQGQAAGGVLQYLAQRDGMKTWLGRRKPFGNLYYGRDYQPGADEVFARMGARNVGGANPIDMAAQLIADGKIVGTYLGRMEYGPRALGARTIMASPADRRINDWLNKRLDRTEFMPFAPVVRAERVKDVFELPESLLYTGRYMTVTCDVKPEWREKIAACVHVDGTARPQIIRREDNPAYYDILAAYEAKTGVPVTINTSFNVHEEPIINKPEEAWTALRDERVDYVTTGTAVWART